MHRDELLQQKTHTAHTSLCVKHVFTDQSEEFHLSLFTGREHYMGSSHVTTIANAVHSLLVLIRLDFETESWVPTVTIIERQPESLRSSHQLYKLTCYSIAKDLQLCKTFILTPLQYLPREFQHAWPLARNTAQP